MNIEEMIAVMQAAKEGAVIQCRRIGDTKWQVVQGPVWDWLSCDYRAEPRPREWFATICEDGSPFSLEGSRDEAEASLAEYSSPKTVVRVREVTDDE